MLSDLRYACRSLARARGLLAAAMVTLALGIGANTAVYSIVYSVLVQPAPYRAPQRLMLVAANMQAAGLPRAPLAGPEVVTFQQQATTFTGVAALQAVSAALTGDGDPEQVRVLRVTSNFFDVLGVSAARGRSFVDADGRQPPVPSIVVSWPFFERRFGGDPASIGRTVFLDGVRVTIVGVLPQTFHTRLAQLSDEIQVFQPFGGDLAQEHRLIRPYRVIARLADGRSEHDAAREAAAISADLAGQFPIYTQARHSFYVTPLVSDSTREIKPMLWALTGGVSLVLIAACVNVGGLLLARSSARRREVATLVALGASRARLARQFIVEGLVIACAGSVAGIAVGLAMLRAIVALRPPGLERLDHAAIDVPVLAALAIAACVLGMLFALAPLTELRTRDLTAGPLTHARTAGRLRLRTRSTLVVAQIALGTVLVIVAGLLVRTLDALYRVEPGFDMQTHALTFRLSWPAGRYPGSLQLNAFNRELEARLAALPGVRDAGAISALPFDAVTGATGKYVTDATNTPEGQAAARFADMRSVSPGVLQALGVQLVRGRWFTEGDDRTSGLPVSIVDEELASRAWPGQNPIGQRLRVPFEVDRQMTAVWTMVVGVVRHVHHHSLGGERREQAYIAFRQNARSGSMTYLVRTAADAPALAADIRRIVAALDPGMPAYDIRGFETYVARAESERRFSAVLISSFAVLTLVLAGVGLAGLLGYSVTTRQREFGVRLAVGATPAQLQRTVLSEASVLVMVGIVVGLAAGGAAAHAVRALLFGVGPADAASYVMAIGLLGATGVIASWWPAHRASRVSPTDALRAD